MLVRISEQDAEKNIFMHERGGEGEFKQIVDKFQ